MGISKLFTLIGMGLVLGFVVAVAVGLASDLPPAVVGPIIGVVVALAAGHMPTRR